MAVLPIPLASAARGEVLYEGKISGDWTTVILLSWPLVLTIVIVKERINPVVLAPAVNFTVLVPILPDIGLTDSHLKSVVSILHESSQVNVKDFVPPVCGIVSDMLPMVSCGAACESLQETKNKKEKKNPAIPIINLFFMYIFFNVLKTGHRIS